MDPFDRDMSNSTTIGFTLLLSSAIAGYCLVNLSHQWKRTQDTLSGLVNIVRDLSAMQVSHAETLTEYDQRIREKQDYDGSEEIEEEKYQAWRGEYEGESCKVEIKLWREKLTKIKENQGWVLWNGEKDGSTTVRDFYLGNLNPDFHWDVQESNYFYRTAVSETFVENWDNVIRLEISMAFESKEALLKFLDTSEFWPNLTSNLALKKTLRENLIQWSRILIDVAGE